MTLEEFINYWSLNLIENWTLVAKSFFQLFSIFSANLAICAIILFGLFWVMYKIISTLFELLLQGVEIEIPVDNVPNQGSIRYLRIRVIYSDNII
jgi:hypothetical protein